MIARLVFTATLAACVGLTLWFLVARQQVVPAAETQFGVTFSSRYAASLGVDPRVAYRAVLDDLGVRRVRLPVYWDATEPQEGSYHFDDLAWYLDEAAARGVALTLAVGMKVPRWPECHIPSWVTNEGRNAALLRYVEALVTRFASHPAVARWQVENEPHFPFGVCPDADLALLADEIALVRRLDPGTPVQLTVSGEQEPWATSAAAADVLGVSMYRFAWNPLTGLVVFPHPAAYYALHARSVARVVDAVIISELQAEPWFVDGARPTTVAEQYAAFTAERLHDHVRFAQQTGISEAYLWGVEWWYALHVAGEPRLWEAAKGYF